MLVKKQNGFTMVELVLAMAIFIFVLIVVINSISGLYRIYQAGVGIRDTQQQARSMSEEITRATRDAAHIITGANSVCLYYAAAMVGDSLVTSSQVFALVDTGDPLTRQLVHRQTSLATIPATGAVCDVNTYPAGTQRVLNSREVSVMLFNPVASATAVSIPQLNTLLTFELRVASRRAFATEITDLAGPDPRCVDGANYCSMTSLTSSVQARSILVGGGG
jgi:type II secretory pathway pseudopilin PulG